MSAVALKSPSAAALRAGRPSASPIRVRARAPARASCRVSASAPVRTPAGLLMARSLRRPAATPTPGSVEVSASASDVPTVSGDVMGSGMKYAVVTARFNSLVTKALLDGCVDTLLAHGVAAEDIVSTWVPGSFELGVVAKNIAGSGKFDAVICLGAIIRGDTSHYDAVVGAATTGVQTASTSTGVPCIFGVLTTDNMDQAINRAGGKAGNIGSNAAATAIETSTLLKKLKAEGMSV